MKKKKLLQILRQSLLRYEPDLSKRDAFNKYYKQIELLLRIVPEDIELNSLSSLEDIEKKNAFEDFVLTSTAAEVEKKLEAICTDIKTFTNMYIAKESDQVRRVATAQAVYIDYINEKQCRNHKIAFPIFITLFTLFSIAVLAFSIMDALEVFAAGTAMSYACTIISAAAGACDFIAGLSFFLYEHHDDKQKREKQEQAQEIIECRRIIKNSYNKFKAGRGSNIHIGDSNCDRKEQLSSEEVDKKLVVYIEENSRNRFSSGKKSDIHIGDE